MIRVSNIKLPLDHGDHALEKAVCKALGIKPAELVSVVVRKRSVDARKKHAILFLYAVDVEVRNEGIVLNRVKKSRDIVKAPDMAYQFPISPSTGESYRGPRPVVVGTGPCGLFAGLLLAQMGLRPVVLERGKPAKARMKDVYRFWREGVLDPESNALFGEGGAGTFSDGKLTTQIKGKANRVRKVLEEFVAAGAPEEILYLQKPHIGTDKLVKVVATLRESIIELGGEVRFDCAVTGLKVEGGAVCGVVLQGGTVLESRHVILAIGHSARDTFTMLQEAGVALQPKPFSIGVRIEHPQALIDQAQYGKAAGHHRLGAADYKLSHHCKSGRSVYTFCMCPGGEVIASASEAGHLVTNGMSAYRRNKPNANAGLLVGVTPEDYGTDHPLAGVAFQREWEKKAYELGGGAYHAPVHLVGDFLQGCASTTLGSVEPSYTPGVVPSDIRKCLPGYVTDAMAEALPMLDRKLKGFAQADAVLTGVETRSSSPLRILRDKDNLESISTSGLYPAGEGAGYAGGITSAAVDGIRVAEAIALKIVE